VVKLSAKSKKGGEQIGRHEREGGTRKNSKGRVDQRRPRVTTFEPTGSLPSRKEAKGTAGRRESKA